MTSVLSLHTALPLRRKQMHGLSVRMKRKWNGLYLELTCICWWFSDDAESMVSFTIACSHGQIIFCDLSECKAKSLVHSKVLQGKLVAVMISNLKQDVSSSHRWKCNATETLGNPCVPPFMKSQCERSIVRERFAACEEGQTHFDHD